MVNVAALSEAFKKSYGKDPRIFSAPGRVNLIGEHTDYNDGFVLPIAIDRRTFVAAAVNGSREVQVSSLDLKDQARFSLDEPESRIEKKWVTYIAGIAFQVQARGIKLSGADLVIQSDVPIGAGLSSSAALEISVGKALLTTSGQGLDPVSLALAAQKAEHVYAGTRCGIMDQLTVTLAQANHALLIDCRSLATNNIKVNLPGTRIVICNTNVKHDLATSAYNQRRRECEQAVEFLSRKIPTLRSLRDVEPIDIEKYASDMPEVLIRRARHVVTENARTRQAAVALLEGDAEKFGKLMSSSHESLRDDYEVSSPELDLLVELAGSFAGVFGARMTGGGFGGCTVNLIQSERFDSFREFIATKYRSLSGIDPAIYAVVADDGVKEIAL